MNANIHPVGFSADEKLASFIHQKLAKLETVYDSIINADVYLKLDSHEQVRDKVVEIKLNVPGTTLFASETAKTFEESTDLAMESIKRQVSKRKEKIKNI
jgi:putative sigma-54 modulation protein